jgi:hypothetical protein
LYSLVNGYCLFSGQCFTMNALRSGETKINHEHFIDGMLEVYIKWKTRRSFMHKYSIDYRPAVL